MTGAPSVTAAPDGHTILWYDDGATLHLNGVTLDHYRHIRALVWDGHTDDPAVRGFLTAIYAAVPSLPADRWGDQRDTLLLEHLGMPTSEWTTNDDRGLALLLGIAPE